MKKTKILSLLLFTTIMLFIGCSEQENVQLEIGDGFIQLADTSASISEDSSGNIKTTVLLGASNQYNTNGIKVNFSISSDDASRYVVSPAGGVLTIPAGEVSADIILTPVDNIINDGNIEVNLTLLNTSDKPIGIGGQGLKNISKKILITDNDCPTIFGSSYGAKVYAFGEEAPSHKVTLVPVPGTTNEFTVSTLWGPTFVSWATGNNAYDNQFVYPAKLTVNSDFSVTVTGAGYATGGSGTYVACEDKFDVVITQALFSSPFTTRVVLTGE